MSRERTPLVCAWAEAALARRAPGATAAPAGLLGWHLSGCARCRATAAHLDTVANVLTETHPPTEPASAELGERVWHRFRSEPRGQPAPYLPTRRLWAAAVIVGLTVAVPAAWHRLGPPRTRHVRIALPPGYSVARTPELRVVRATREPG